MNVPLPLVTILPGADLSSIRSKAEEVSLIHIVNLPLANTEFRDN